MSVFLSYVLYWCFDSVEKHVLCYHVSPHRSETEAVIPDSDLTIQNHFNNNIFYTSNNRTRGFMSEADAEHACLLLRAQFMPTKAAQWCYVAKKA